MSKVGQRILASLREAVTMAELQAEITRLRAENERLREALIRIDGMATTICMKDDAGYGIRAESVMPIYETARAALEGVMEPPR